MSNPLRRRRLGGSTFSPLSIAGLITWLKADALGLADGTAVATWTDSSSQGNTVTQATGSRQPTFKTNILNGLPVLRFVAANVSCLQRVTYVGGAISQPNVLFVVCSHTSGAAAGEVIIDGGTNTTRNEIFYAATGNKSGVFAGTEVDGASQIGTAPVVLTGVLNGAASALYQNGALFVSGNAGAQTMNGVTVGAFNGIGSGVTGDIAEVLVYNALLTTAQQKAVERYLGGKYGIGVV